MIHRMAPCAQSHEWQVPAHISDVTSSSRTCWSCWVGTDWSCDLATSNSKIRMCNFLLADSIALLGNQNTGSPSAKHSSTAALALQRASSMYNHAAAIIPFSRRRRQRCSRLAPATAHTASAPRASASSQALGPSTAAATSSLLLTTPACPRFK